MKQTRRQFMEKIVMILGATAFRSQAFAKSIPNEKVTEEVRCSLYRAINGTPSENTIKVIELMGGIEEIIDAQDVVLIKPNVQWWNQGAPNLSAVKTFIDLVMDRKGGFHGEVILAENCHRGATPWMAPNSGWDSAFSRNSDLDEIVNYNDLSAELKKRYGNRFTTSHWIDVDSGGKRIFRPSDGPGYVYCDGTGGVSLISLDNGCKGDNLRKVIMTYPVFKTDKGTIVDFKNGIWEKGTYTKQTLKFINFSALNHHGAFTGATSAVKNYLGISDLSGGADPDNGGRLTERYFNFHSFPFNKWSAGPVPGMLGSEIGVFMKMIRKADLNITTAEWIGISSRTEPPVAHTRAILACEDPVVLDYHACKYLLYPNSRIQVHNPDDNDGPLHQYLKECAEKGGWSLNKKNVSVKSYDFKKQSLHTDTNLIVKGDMKWWGSDIKSITKYLMLRFL